MPSIALPGRRYIGGPPPVCRKPPQPGPLTPPGFPAATLQVFVHWTDYPTWPPWDSVEIFPIQPTPPGITYQGESKAGNDKFKCLFSKNAATETWNILIDSYRPDRMTLAAFQSNVYIDPTRRFTTSILHYWGDFHFFEAYFQITT